MQGDSRKCCTAASGGSGRSACLGWVCQRSREMMRDVWLVLRVRSFQIIVLQVTDPCLLLKCPKHDAMAWTMQDLPVRPAWCG